MPIDANELMDIAVRVRRTLEPQWLEWHSTWGPPEPPQLSQWTCVRSSLFLSAILNEHDLSAQLVTGVPIPLADQSNQHGYRSPQGWVSHAWVHVGKYIVDVTHDQFGGSDVLIVSEDDARFRPGCDEATTLPVTAAGRKAVDLALLAWRRRERNKGRKAD